MLRVSGGLDLRAMGKPATGQEQRMRNGGSHVASRRRRMHLKVNAQAVSEREDGKRRVVVTGMSVASCYGNDVDTFYDNLLQGKSAVDRISGFDASEYPVDFAAEIKDFDSEGLIDAKNERRYDDCLKYAVVSGKKALAHAGLECGSDTFNKLDRSRCGVLAGTGMGGLQVLQDNIKNMMEKGYRRMSPFFIPYSITNMGGALLGIDIGFEGPNYSISTACASANYSFISAANHIRDGDADLMIAGGVEAAVVPIGIGGFIACKALSSRKDNPAAASRPFDKHRDGFVMGEGAGMLVLESLDHALERGAPILAEYLGGAVNCDAYHMTEPKEDGSGVSACINDALSDANVDIERVNHVNAHATSTSIGDAAEVKALKQVFGDHTPKMKINSSKSMIGHALGAAGGLEGVATLKAIETGKVHPTINQDELDDDVQDLDTVPEKAQELDPDVAISNSFGFGGHNSVVAFSKYSPEL